MYPVGASINSLCLGTINFRSAVEPPKAEALDDRGPRFFYESNVNYLRLRNRRSVCGGTLARMEIPIATSTAAIRDDRSTSTPSRPLCLAPRAT